MNLDQILHNNHQQIIFKKKGSAKMILAYHSFSDICFGGIRLLPHNTKEKAIKDALRLSEAMTYKLALINEPYGGCKAVVLEPKDGKTNDFLHNIGELIEEEQGRFISAIDFGFEPDDAKIIKEKTNYILAIKDSEFGQSGVTTAFGVIEGIKTTLNEVYGSDRIKGRSYAVQGLGSVGRTLAKNLINRGGNVYVSDLNQRKLKEFEGKAKIVSPDEILFLDVDVLSPCGPSYVINNKTIPKLKSKIIAGAANCQLEDEVKDDKKLNEKGILVAPDYAINSGGVIQGIEEFKCGTLEKAIERLPLISNNLQIIYQKSREENLGTYTAAKQIAVSRRLHSSPFS